MKEPNKSCYLVVKLLGNILVAIVGKYKIADKYAINVF